MHKNNTLIKEIVSMEWHMFIKVNEGRAIADCQEDQRTFFGMRTAQFRAWSDVALNSYLEDLNNAEKCNRNLIAEKYIHMMKTTAPIEYIMFLDTIELPDEDTLLLAKDINEKLMEQTKILFNDYPYVTSMGRPLESICDDKNNTSIETYQLGELYTYSKKTLSFLKAHIEEMYKNGHFFAKEVLGNTVNYWGYDDLKTAETAMRRQYESV